MGFLGKKGASCASCALSHSEGLRLQTGTSHLASSQRGYKLAGTPKTLKTSQTLITADRAAEILHFPEYGSEYGPFSKHLYLIGRGLLKEPDVSGF